MNFSWPKMVKTYIDIYLKKLPVTFPAPYHYWWCMKSVRSASSIISNLPEWQGRGGGGASRRVGTLRPTILRELLVIHSRYQITWACTCRPTDPNSGHDNKNNRSWYNITRTPWIPIIPFRGLRSALEVNNYGGLQSWLHPTPVQSRAVQHPLPCGRFWRSWYTPSTGIRYWE